MKTRNKYKTLEGVNSSIVKDYACEDVDLTYELHNLMLPQINNLNLQEVMKLDCQLVSVIAEMEFNGVLIDQAKLATIETTIDKQMMEYREQIEKYTLGAINLNSKPQLSTFLFNQLELVPVGSKGKGGHFSVSSEVLRKISPQHRVVSALLDYNALYKVKSTFIKALKQVNLTTGRLHTSFNQTVTETGRLSSSGPNLQNIPSRTYGKLLRECFVAPEGWHYIGADYSNIELRVMAVLSLDEEMLKAYWKNRDLHRLTASKIFNITYEEVDDKLQRPIGKTINFGLIYGMTEVGLSKKLANEGKNFSVEQCKQFIHDFFELYKGVAKFSQELIYRATQNGYSETLFGRRRPLENITSTDHFKREAAKRLAMNTPIQGTAADILKIAMVNIHNIIKDQKLKSKMLLQVHDELLFEVPEPELKLMKKLVRQEMKKAVSLPVPLEVDLKIGKTWADVH